MLSILYIEKSKDNFELAEKNTSSAGQEDKINLIFDDALDMMKKLDKKFDLIFLVGTNKVISEYEQSNIHIKTY